MKVLHLERKFIASTETFIANQINSLKTFENIVFTIKHAKNIDVKCTVYSPGGKKNLIAYKRLNSRHLMYFNEQLLFEKPKIIHSHFLTDARFFHPFTKNLSIPKVCSCYGYDVSKFPKRFGFLAKKYFKRTFKEYDVFLAMTEDMKKDLVSLGCPEKKIIVHYYGTDTLRFNLKRNYEINAKFVLLTIASLVPKKGHLIVLKSVKLIKKRYPNLNFEYNIIGQGPLDKKLRQFVKRNFLSDVVNFKGAISQGELFKHELNKAHVFVHHSIRTKSGDKEGIPGTIVEAMASGLPVISTYHAGIPYVINNWQTGLLISEGDFEELADKIILLYKNENLRRNIGQKAMAFSCQKLDIYKGSKNLESIYNSLIELDYN